MLLYLAKLINRGGGIELDFKLLSVLRVLATTFIFLLLLLLQRDMPFRCP